MKSLRASVLILLLLICGQGAPQRNRSELAEELAKARAELLKAAMEHRASLEKLLALYESEIPARMSEVERRRELYERGIISRLELEQSERELAQSQAKVDEARSRIAEVDNIIAEVRAAEQIEEPARPGQYRATALLIRYSGTARWSISEIAKIESFFLSRFKRPLPISALGQSPTHDRLGYDHSNAVDVALHPDSPEGRALIEYLRGAGIPFTAFREALPGSSTGAHIHIGRPSQRRAGLVGGIR